MIRCQQQPIYSIHEAPFEYVLSEPRPGHVLSADLNIPEAKNLTTLCCEIPSEYDTPHQAVAPRARKSRWPRIRYIERHKAYICSLITTRHFFHGWYWLMIVSMLARIKNGFCYQSPSSILHAKCRSFAGGHSVSWMHLFFV